MSTVAAKSTIAAKSSVRGTWRAIMDHTRYDRQMQLSSWRSRCFTQNEIHEFVVCQEGTDPASTIDEVAYLGFAELSEGGVVEVNDRVWCGEHVVGTVLGFDETHTPNHYNIVIAAPTVASGYARGLAVGGSFTIGK